MDKQNNQGYVALTVNFETEMQQPIDLNIIEKEIKNILDNFSLDLKDEANVLGHLNRDNIGSKGVFLFRNTTFTLIYQFQGNSDIIYSIQVAIYKKMLAITSSTYKRCGEMGFSITAR